MHMFKGLVAASMLALPFSSFAEGLSYNYVEAGYVKITPDDSDIESDGYGVRFSGKVSDVVYLHASYSGVETDEFSSGVATGSLEGRTFQGGLGIRAPLAEGSDFIAEAAYIYAEIEGQDGFSGLSDDDNGFGLSGGIRHLFAPQFEGGASVNYVDIGDEGDTSYTLSALVHVTPAFSIEGGYSFTDDAKSWTAGARFNF